MPWSFSERSHSGVSEWRRPVFLCVFLFFFFLIEGVLGSLTEWRHPGLSLGEVAQDSVWEAKPWSFSERSHSHF